MRYLLVVGFACDVYRREPRARIFVGDRLIDDFHIPNTTSNLFISQLQLKKLHRLQPYAPIEFHNVWIKNHPPLKFYELEISDKITNLALRIDIDNHDSNYSNGYITKSTLIRLEVCAFFPLKPRILLRLKKIRDGHRIRENYAWYRVLKNQIFDLACNGMRWQGANGQKISNISSGSFFEKDKIGGDGAFVCELTKKYGILLPTLLRLYRYNFDHRITDYFFDKYEQHANQRNFN